MESHDAEYLGLSIGRLAALVEKMYRHVEEERSRPTGTNPGNTRFS
jgi:hypothetical protein